MMPFDEKCFFSKCRKDACPDFCINSSYAKHYYCEKHWGIISVDIKHPRCFARDPFDRPNYLLQKSQRYNLIHGRRDRGNSP